MYNRKKLDHERLELILVQILMKVRLIILVLGILLFLYALAIMLNSIVSGVLIGIVGLYLTLLGTSFWMITKTARFLTWVSLVGKNGANLISCC